MKKILMTFCVLIALAIPLLAVDYAKGTPQNVAIVSTVGDKVQTANINFASSMGVLAAGIISPTSDRTFVKAIYYSRYVEVRARSGPNQPLRC